MKFIEKNGYIKITLDCGTDVCFTKSIALQVAHRLIDYAVYGKDEREAKAAEVGTPTLLIECVHGEFLDGLCNACADEHGRDYRLIRTPR